MTTTLSVYLGQGEQGAARKAALVDLARDAGHMFNGEPSIGRWLCALADNAHTKPPLEQLDSLMVDTTAPMGPQSLDWLEDAIVIRQQQIMSMRLNNYDIATITGDSKGWAWQSYIIVRDPASERTVYADLAECRVLLDTAREMKDPAAAFERWLPKVKEMSRCRVNLRCKVCDERSSHAVTGVGDKRTYKCSKCGRAWSVKIIKLPPPP